jgi:hypothetical protein
MATIAYPAVENRPEQRYDSGAIPDGSTTGDIIRWNDSLGGWEVADEPFEFAGIILTPALASLIDAAGAMYFKSDTQAVMVCTEV